MRALLRCSALSDWSHLCCNRFRTVRSAEPIDLDQCTAGSIRNHRIAGKRPEREGVRMHPVPFPRRMIVLDIHPAAVARSEPASNHDLQIQCQRCERDLRCDADNPAWRTYCPKAELLDAMPELWWLKIYV